MGRVIPAAVLDARAEAAALVAGARAEAEALREAARRQGREAGRAEAAAELAASLIAARAEAAELLADSRPAALVIAGKMAEKIVGRAVALDPAVMADIAGEALAACRPRGGPVRLRVHPDHLAALEAGRAALLARLGAAAALELVADEAVGRGGCLVETAVGRVDARLDAQIAALERALAGGGAGGDDGDGDGGPGGDGGRRG